MNKRYVCLTVTLALIPFGLIIALYDRSGWPLWADLLLAALLAGGQGCAALIVYLYLRPEKKTAAPEPAAKPAPEPATEAETAEAAGKEKILAGHELSPREKEVASLLIRGLSTRAISGQLYISENTVNTHIKNILRKFGVSGRKAFLINFIE